MNLLVHNYAGTDERGAPMLSKHLLVKVCEAVHEAQGQNHPETPTIVEAADAIINNMVQFVRHNDVKDIEYIPSFADLPGTIVKDNHKGFCELGGNGTCFSFSSCCLYAKMLVVCSRKFTPRL